jgi:hypothetical protein
MRRGDLREQSSQRFSGLDPVKTDHQITFYFMQTYVSHRLNHFALLAALGQFVRQVFIEHKVSYRACSGQS